MAARFDPTDPRCLTPNQRLEHLTAILATGARRVVRLGADTVIPADVPAPPPPPESAQNPLDVSPRKSVHGPARLTQAEKTEGVEA